MRGNVDRANLSKEQQRALIKRDHDDIQEDKVLIHGRLNEGKSETSNLIDNLVGKGAVDTSIKDNFNQVETEASRKIAVCTASIGQAAGQSNSSNLQLELAAATTESRIIHTMYDANAAHLAALNSVRENLLSEDKEKLDSLVAKHENLGLAVEGHDARYEADFQEKEHFEFVHGEDWNRTDYDSLVEDYADPNLEQPSYMDPED
jgi:hypothetical protein